jgi:sulfatase maturation enzyme AslB (radical SAM superfamily)
MMKIKNSIEYFKKLTSVADCRRCEWLEWCWYVV